MTSLALHELHAQWHGTFTEVNGFEIVAHYGDWPAEHAALRAAAGVMDLSPRSRLVLMGEDRVRLLNGQVTNNVKDLPVGGGCYAALVTNKGKLQSDLNIFILPGEILLDFEPGLAGAITDRFHRYIIADDVQVIDAAPHYGLLSVQGPRAWAVVGKLGLVLSRPAAAYTSQQVQDATLGEIFCMNHPRLGGAGYDLFVPVASLGAVAAKLVAAARELGGCPVGWQAWETARIEAGLPRFGAEMDETNLAPEAGLEIRAISYTKGCYIGQEVIARLRTYGQVAKALRGLRLDAGPDALPRPGDKLLAGDKEVGYVCSAIHSPALAAPVALAYVRREHNQPGTGLRVRTAAGVRGATVVHLPFAPLAGAPPA